MSSLSIRVDACRPARVSWASLLYREAMARFDDQLATLHD